MYMCVYRWRTKEDEMKYTKNANFLYSICVCIYVGVFKVSLNMKIFLFKGVNGD